MTDKMIGNKEVAELVGMKLSYWYKMKDTPEWCGLVGPRENKWYKSDVDAFLDAKKAARRAEKHRQYNMSSAD